jgi:hypothetical protein
MDRPLFSWLHLSDIHFGEPGAAVRQRKELILTDLLHALPRALDEPSLDAREHCTSPSLLRRRLGGCSRWGNGVVGINMIPVAIASFRSEAVSTSKQHHPPTKTS